MLERHKSAGFNDQLADFLLRLCWFEVQLVVAGQRLILFTLLQKSLRKDEIPMQVHTDINQSAILPINLSAIVFTYRQQGQIQLSVILGS